MLRHYCGEFLVSPVPLHFGLNWCSHNCFYCFANLNKPDRRATLSHIKKFGAAMRGKDDTIEGVLLRAGHPVLIANDSDPFAKSNQDVFLPIYEEMTSHGVTAAIQTKGGDLELENLVLNGNRTLVYISLTSDDNDFLKRAEPSAPCYEHRIDLIKRAVDKGHFVVVGINPLVEHWWINFDDVIATLIKIGVERVWVGRLHLSPDQVKNITEKRKAEFLGEIKKASKKTDIISERMIKKLDKHFNVYDGLSMKGDFWSGYNQGIETADGYFAHLKFNAEQLGVSELIVNFDSFCDFIIPGCLKDLHGSKFKELIKPFRRTVYNATGKEPVIYSMKEALSYYWNVLDYPSIMRCDNLSVLMDNGNIVTDNNGNNLMIYSTKQRPDIYFQDNEALIELR